jgi:hypothetical protein
MDSSGHIWYTAASGTGSTAATLQEYMRLDPSGRLGIGTSAPVGNLDVTFSNSTVYSNSNMFAGGISQYIYNSSTTDGVASTLALAAKGPGTTAQAAISAIYSSTGVGHLAFGTRSGGNVIERMRLTSTGLGIGTTSPAVELEVSSPSNTQILINCQNDTGNSQLWFGDASSDEAGVIVYRHADNSMAFEVNDTEALRIDSSKRLLVGTSTVTGFQTGVKHIFMDGGGASYSSVSIGNPGGAADNTDINLTAWTGSGSNFYTSKIRQVGDGSLVFHTQASSSANGAGSPTERMRITSGGAMWLNTTTGTVGTTAFGTVFASDGVGSFRTSRNVDGVDHVAIVSGNVGIFVVRGDGDCENTNNSYGALSDVKLKENIVNASSQWNDISALQVRNYNFKTETGYRNHTQIGLIAQEVELVSPGLVSESPDRDEDGNDLGSSS